MGRFCSVMTNKHQPTRLTYILLLIFCLNSLAASKKCDCESNDLYAFRSKGWDAVVLDAAEADQVKLQHFNGSGTQLWRFRPAAKLGAFFIINEHHGKAMDFTTKDDGIMFLGVRDWNQDSLQQQWNFDVHGHIVNAANGKVVDVQREEYALGTRLILWTEHSCACQVFFMERHVQSGDLKT